MAFGDRLGLVGLILAFLAVAIAVLWPGKKWIGWVSFAGAILLVGYWVWLEVGPRAIVAHQKYPLRTGVLVFVGGGAIILALWMLVASSVTEQKASSSDAKEINNAALQKDEYHPLVPATKIKPRAEKVAQPSASPRETPVRQPSPAPPLPMSTSQAPTQQPTASVAPARMLTPVSDPHKRSVLQRLYMQAVATQGMARADYLDRRLEALGEKFGYDPDADYGQNSLPTDMRSACQLVDPTLFHTRLQQFTGFSLTIIYERERASLAEQLHEALQNAGWSAIKRVASQNITPQQSVSIQIPVSISEQSRAALREGLLAELAKNGIQVETQYVRDAKSVQIMIPNDARVGEFNVDSVLRSEKQSFLAQNWPLPGKEKQALEAVFGDVSSLSVPQRFYLYWVITHDGVLGEWRPYREGLLVVCVIQIDGYIGQHEHA